MSLAGVRAVLHAYPCTHCGAGRGGRCRTRTGRPVSMPHAARYDAATRAGRLPLAEPTQPMEMPR